MTKPAKIIVGIFAAILLVTIGFIIASLIQGGDLPREKTLTFSILVRTPGDFEIDMEPKNPETGDIEVHIIKGEPAVFTITLSSNGGWDSPVALEVAGLPEGVEFALSGNPIIPDRAVTLTVQTMLLQSNTAYVCSLTAIEASD